MILNAYFNSIGGSIKLVRLGLYGESKRAWPVAYCVICWVIFKAVGRLLKFPQDNREEAYEIITYDTHKLWLYAQHEMWRPKTCKANNWPYFIRHPSLITIVIGLRSGYSATLAYRLMKELFVQSFMTDLDLFTKPMVAFSHRSRWAFEDIKLWKRLKNVIECGDWNGQQNLTLVQRSSIVLSRFRFNLKVILLSSRNEMPSCVSTADFDHYPFGGLSWALCHSEWACCPLLTTLITFGKLLMAHLWAKVAMRDY